MTKRARSLTVLLVVCGLALAVLIGVTLLGSARESVPQQGPIGQVGQVYFPDVWMIKDPDIVGANRPLMGSNIYEVSEASDGSQLVFRVREYSVSGPRSDNAYAVDVEGSFSVRTALDSEWRADGLLPHFHSEAVDGFGLSPQSQPSVRFRDRDIQVAKGELQMALPSQDGRWIAVLSKSVVTDPNYKPSIFSFLGGPAKHGDLFVDIHDTRTGQRVAVAQYHFDTRSGTDSFFGDAFWLKDRYFVLPIDYRKRACIIARMPNSQQM
jgi:hypothetical protein